FMRNAPEHRRFSDFVAIQMKDWQDGPIMLGIEEFIGVPAGREGSRFRFAIANHASGDEAGIVEDRPIGVGKRIAELSSFMDRTGGLWRRVARDPAGERKLFEEEPHPLFILR